MNSKRGFAKQTLQSSKGRSSFKMVIFDWAGTIIDFGCRAPLEAFKLAFDTVNIHVTDKEIKEFMGLDKKTHIRHILDQFYTHTHTITGIDVNLSTRELSVEIIYMEFIKQLQTLLPKYAVLTPGYKELVTFLREHDIKIGSTSGYDRQTINQIINAMSESDRAFLPEIIITSDMVVCGRPGPTMIYRNLADSGLNIKPDQVIKIGDTIADIAEGRAAGCRTVAVIDSSSAMGLSLAELNAMPLPELNYQRFLIAKEFKAAGADLIVKDLTELLQFVSSGTEF